MATYYDVLSVPQDAPREEIERALERMAQRLKQTGQWEQYQDQFRKIENTLLNPDLRIQYDMQNRLKTALRPAAPAAVAKTPPAPASKAAKARAGGRGGIHKGLLWGGVAALVLGLGYGAWLLVDRAGRRVDAGIYLLDPGTGDKVAVVLSREPDHHFPDRDTPAAGVLIYRLSRKQAVWVGEAVLDIEFEKGDAAPEALLAEGREAAKTQDTHQSMR